MGWISSFRTTTTCVNDNAKADNLSDSPSSSISNSSSNSTPCNYHYPSTSTLTKRNISIDRTKKYLDTDGWIPPMGVLLIKLIHPMKALMKNVPLPVSKRTPINNNKKEIPTFCWLQPSLFWFFLPYFRFSLFISLFFLFTRNYYISTWVKIFYIMANYFTLNLVYRVEISTRDENLHIISP